MVRQEANRIVTVFGGSGFIGRYVVERLAARGDRVRVAVRHPNDALFLKPMGDLGQIEIMATNIKNEASVRRALTGTNAVINLVGILFESGGQSFDTVQAKGPGLVARLAAEAGVKSFVQMSALGAALASDSRYAHSKALGEQAVLAAFPSASIVRPSVVFGAEDGFFNRFAALAATVPLLPIPGADTRFQPVFVQDVADAVVRLSLGGADVVGKTFALGGPEVKSLRALLEQMMDYTGVHRPIIGLPWGLAMLQATVLGLLPTPPLTRDQVILLRTDNVVPDGVLGFDALAITPTAISAVLPSYMVHYRRHGQFGLS